ncbi:DMT family transporter [Vibrio tritonius]|uniref:DMT family transporter n=1 Tax=Vibrio tritonius TaxID=1435069 RepID=A0ABS7YGF3_9VIBR|nr:DMT family transporter [Vibrio tritonius]MCA2014748.1 DMT family transporter [Vibrio tritonius]
MESPPSSSPIFPIGVRFMFLSALGFSLMTAFVKGVSNYGIPVFEIVAARAFVSLIISYIDVKRKRISIWGNNKKLLFARGAFGTASLMCVYYAVTSLPLAEATILQYVHPIFTALLAVLFLKERVQPATIVCIVLCLLGLYTMLHPELASGQHSDIPLFSVGIALLGAFGSSIAYVIVKKLSRTEDSSVIIFYFPMVALPISALLIGRDFIWPEWHVTVMMILVGVFTQVGQYGLTKAMQTQDAGRASAFSYIQIVFSICIGVIWFQEIPSVWTYLGGIFIVSGALINVFGQRIPLLRRRV